MTERRSTPRLEAEILIFLVEATSVRPLWAHGVSRRGMFVHTDSPRPERHIVRLRIPLGRDEPDLEANAMVVHSLSPEEARRLGRVPGMGLQLYGLDDVARQRWSEFVVVFNDADDVSPQRAVPVRPIDAVKRRHPRYLLAWPVKIVDGETARSAVTRDVALGGAFVLVEGPYALGADIELILLRPDGATLSILGRVTRHAARHERAGVGIAYHRQTQDQRDELCAFIEEGLTVQELSDELIILDDCDPMLE